MAESIFSTFDISGQGMSIQRKRLAAVAKNIANVNTTKGPDGQPYKREIVTVKAGGNNSFSNELKTQLSIGGTNNSLGGTSFLSNQSSPDTILEAQTEFDSSTRMVYDPSHPHADKEGYVKMPNINIVTEMVEMISAQKSFEANTGVIESAKNIARDSLEI